MRGDELFRTQELIANVLGVSLRTLPRPDIALVHLGTRDMSGSLDSAIVEPMRDIVTLLRNANPEVKMLIAQIPAGLAQGLYLHYRIDRLAAEMSAGIARANRR